MAGDEKTAVDATLEHHGEEFKRIATEQEKQWDEIEKKATKKEVSKLEIMIEKIRDRPPLWCTALITFLASLVTWLARGAFGG